jgi:selenocysteine lyase/cysteine desulfurase
MPTFTLTFSDHTPDAIARHFGQRNICADSANFYVLDLIQQLGCKRAACCTSA